MRRALAFPSPAKRGAVTVWRGRWGAKLARRSRISRSLSSGRPLRAGPVGSIRATRCWRNNQHKTLSRRDLRPSFAHGGERRMARSPDERPAKSGAGLQARKPLPDFTEPVIGPATSGRTRWFHPGHERKGGGTPADAYLQPPHPQPSSFPLAGEDRGGGAARVRRGRARLSAFHRGSCLGDPTPPLSSGYALPGTQPRRVLAALRLSQSSELLADRS
jgi:hypothetical protein